MWKRLVFAMTTPSPSITFNFTDIGPTIVHRRFEFTLYDCIFMRLDYFGMCGMYLIPKFVRRPTVRPLDITQVVGAPFAQHF